MKGYAEYIKENLTERELLEQLAEEAAELGQAALKLIRAKELSNNPTPMDIDTAAANLLEEFSDVSLAYYLFDGRNVINLNTKPKLERWAGRIKEAKAARAKEGGEENGIN